jgi:hypothetical protein
MQFGYGSRAALALTHTPVSVIAFDTATRGCGEPCAGYLNAYFGNRLSYAKLPPSALMDVLGRVSYESCDAIHVDASIAPEIALHSLACAIAYAQRGTALIVTGMACERVADKMGALRSRDILVPHGDLSSMDQAAFIVQKTPSIEAGEVLRELLVA